MEELVFKYSFQFPTGWNSTRAAAQAGRTERVSIPNGMEFYIIIVVLGAIYAVFQFPTGWNSTVV